MTLRNTLISLGMMAVPVAVESAAVSEDSLATLCDHGGTGDPVRINKRDWCSTCEAVPDKEHLVKGKEVGEGFAVLSAEELEAIKEAPKPFGKRLDAPAAPGGRGRGGHLAGRLQLLPGPQGRHRGRQLRHPGGAGPGHAQDGLCGPLHPAHGRVAVPARGPGRGAVPDPAGLARPGQGGPGRGRGDRQAGPGDGGQGAGRAAGRAVRGRRATPRRPGPSGSGSWPAASRSGWPPRSRPPPGSPST